MNPESAKDKAKAQAQKFGDVCKDMQGRKHDLALLRARRNKVRRCRLTSA